jgi:hypothetical protein
MGLVNDIRPILYDAVEGIYRDNESLTAIVVEAEKTIGIAGYIANCMLQANGDADKETLLSAIKAAKDCLLHATNEYKKKVCAIYEDQRLRADDRKAAPSGAGEPVRQV